MDYFDHQSALLEGDASMTRERLIFLVLAGGFLTLGLEIRHLHREVLDETWQAYIPIVYSFLAAAASIVCLFASGAPRLLATLVFGAGLVVGPLGLYNHTEGELDKMLTPILGSLVAHAGNGDEDGEREKRRDESDVPPPLAPLGISGLSAIGLILSWPAKRRS
jgi:hypothetical protein